MNGSPEAPQYGYHRQQGELRFVSRIEIEGARLSRTEMNGIANVLLAGGRDTVVKLLTGALWYLSSSIADRESLRYFTPLPSMERVPKEIHDLPEEDRDPADFVRISFVFGFGPHTCIGNHVAEIEAKVFLSNFLREVSNWELLDTSEIEFESEQNSSFPGTFHSLHLKISKDV